jgi:hypothetical protein
MIRGSGTIVGDQTQVEAGSDSIPFLSEAELLGGVIRLLVPGEIKSNTIGLFKKIYNKQCYKKNKRLTKLR